MLKNIEENQIPKKVYNAFFITQFNNSVNEKGNFFITFFSNNFSKNKKIKFSNFNIIINHLFL